ncbi:dentin sialophosphoprotein-like [Ostrinia nubilalis]|uniref:dentin sialophosphoprotein-like n=1 Tax=Ostrinia nubilalis TaxID=29057 RepID=UPI0030822AC8
MAEDEDGVSDKKTPQNSNNAGPSQENEQNATKPDLGIEEAKYNSNENGASSPSEAQSSSSKSTGATRKEDNPFSFRHFLKRDLSLPGNSTYENTGARPKVYANTVQHSPTKIDVHAESRREKSRPTDTQAKEKTSDGSNHRISDNTSSSSSVEVPFSVVDNSESKHNFYTDNSDAPFHPKPKVATEPIGMPSLPDFVQDHLIVEQAYLNPNGPLSVDLDNLPDFTINTSFNAGSTSSLGRRNNSSYSNRNSSYSNRNSSYNNRNYDYDVYNMGAASTSNDSGPSRRGIPLDLPVGAEAAGPVPLDLPAHLNLDLTESVNPADRRNPSPRRNLSPRRNPSPRSTFPLDLPPNAGAESMRLPDFLPVHPGRTSPEPAHHEAQLQQLQSDVQRLRSELFAERTRRARAESEAATALDAIGSLRLELDSTRAALREARRSDRMYAAQLDAAAQSLETGVDGAANRVSEAELTIQRLRSQIRKLKEELAHSQREERAARALQARVGTDLRRATTVADTSLRELLAGLEQLKNLSTTLHPT